MKVIIQNARVIDPTAHIDQVLPVYIADGNLIAITPKLADFNPDQIIDATHKILLPGVIDLYANLPEPGNEYKATLTSEMQAAIHAGVTAVCCAPATAPVIDSAKMVEFIKAHAEAARAAQVLVYGALTHGLASQQLSDMAALKRAGCVAVTNAHFPITDTRLLRHCFEYAATFDLTVVMLAQDAYLSSHGLIHEGKVSVRTGLVGIPVIAESIEVARAIQLAEFTKTKLHFTQVTTAQSVALIAAAKAKGLPVTCDVSINHLWLTEIDVSDYNTNCLVYPPLRDLVNQQALIRGLQAGTIDAICSAHTPLEANAKRCPFNQALPGIASLEMLVPLSFRLVIQKKLTLEQWIGCLTSRPAAIMQQPALGKLEIGAPANFMLFDPNTINLFDKETMLSAARNTPYHQWLLQGRVERVFHDLACFFKQS